MYVIIYFLISIFCIAEHVSAEARKVFEDVEEDFSQLKRIVAWLEEWRARDLPTYSDAYVSYNLPKIFSPYIRYLRIKKFQAMLQHGIFIRQRILLVVWWKLLSTLCLRNLKGHLCLE